ncbi:MAG: o-succinylbenzoate--CoA ligase, partial [Myxococcales bacterium]|nr:o-succinylbenzoate--CoA ligase [Myxococcales bacterium]
MLNAPWLFERAAVTPDRAALHVDGATLRFGALALRVRHLAAALRARGVRCGDVVAVLLENELRFVEILHALDACGATLLPLNVRLSPRELCFQLGDSGARLLLHGSEALAETAAVTARMAPGVERVSADALDDTTAPIHLEPLAPRAGTAAPLAILYTSGTTGRPRGACLSRDNFLWSAVSASMHLGVHRDDHWLACLPLFHVGGLSILLRGVLCGTSTLLHRRFDADAVNRSIDTERVTHVSLTATMLQRVLEARGGRDAPAHLRCALIGGGPCSREIFERARARRFPIALTYGLTEAASQVATRPACEEGGPDAGLTPLLGTELRIVDARGAPVPTGVEGEIWVKSPSVMSGYIREPEGEGTSLRDGWLRTGDMGALDAEGRLRVFDRRSDLIISGGENVYPAEVEAALREHPAIADVGVTGVDDDEYGRRPA